MTLSREDINLGSGKWWRLELVPPVTWRCGYCGDIVGSDQGYYAGNNPDGSGPQIAWIRICPTCKGPTVFTRTEKHFPGSAPGNVVSNVPNELSKLYNEARVGAEAGAYTGAVLLCRKMLMNIAVQEGAKEGESFVSYVEYLADNNYVPPKGKVWVDYIRTRANEANHEIALMEEKDAVALITFIEMLLRFIYEFPNKVPSERSVP